MPKVSKDSAAQIEDHGPVRDRHQDLDGYTITSFALDEVHAAIEHAATDAGPFRMTVLAPQRG